MVFTSIKYGSSWSKSEMGRLKRLYPLNQTRDVAKMLGRTSEAIKRKARKLGLLKDYAGGYRPRRWRNPATWSKEDIRLLKKLYPKTPNKEIATKLKRTLGAVVTKAADLGLRKSEGIAGQSWTEKEINFLKKSYEYMTARQIGEKLGRSDHSVRRMASIIQITNNDRRSWSLKEDDVIRRYFYKTNYPFLAVRLNRTISSVKSRANKLGLFKQTCWSENEIRILKKLYRSHTYQEIAEIIGRPVDAVRTKGRRLKLSQSII